MHSLVDFAMALPLVVLFGAVLGGMIALRRSRIDAVDIWTWPAP